ncbi:MAG TPA: PDZ domain-containing protein, partial [Methylomirabilota bacterium]|nr:PDZ domain-containing protein [Methylomirabilota bacterium]
TILVILILFVMVGGGVLLLVLLLRKRGSTAVKVLAVLCGVALLLFLFIIGLSFIWLKVRRAEASRAVTVEQDQKQKRQRAAEDWANQRPPRPQAAGPSAGIGVAVSRQAGRFIISSIVPNTPAARDGRLLAGHQVLAVEDEGRDAVSLDGMALADVIKLLRGEPGSIVTLHVQPSYMVLVEPIRIRLVRERLALLEAETKGQLLTNATTTKTPAP